jgi:hypothetical protein
VGEVAGEVAVEAGWIVDGEVAIAVDGAEFVSEAPAVIVSPVQVVVPDGFGLTSRGPVKNTVPVLSFTAALNEVLLGRSTLQA